MASSPQSAPPQYPPAASPGGAPRSESPFLTLITAGLFLYVGFVLGLTSNYGHALYDGSVLALVWIARVVGIGLLAVAGLTWIGVRWADPLSFALSVIAAVGCLAVGAIWIAFGDTQGWLVLLFGALNAGAAWSGARALGRGPVA